ncbi:MAG: hypothetical protein ACKVQS_04565 [Fimbriimonadaceae bacterium]
MGLVWKPHDLVVWKLVPDVVDGVLVRSEWVSGATVSGLLVEKSSKEVKDLIDLESRNPAVVLLDDASGVEMGDRLELDGVFYRVLADPQVLSMGLVTDHARLIVERLNL